MGFTVIVAPKNPTIDAEALEVVLPGEAPKDYVQRVAEIKRDQPHVFPAVTTGSIELKTAQLEGDASTRCILLAADTTVEIDGHILGKPANAQEARRMLQQLSGRSHWVHTAVAAGVLVASPAAGEVPNKEPGLFNKRTILVSSEVKFAPLCSDWISAYVASGEPMDKAGAYGIQGIAGSMIPSIRGSYSAIMGLPLYETQQLILDLHHG
jgi:septum formation protein